MSTLTFPPKARSSRGAWRAAFIMAALALACGVLLTGVSVWFLAAVALAGAGPAALTFNFHHPSALVRLFATLRTGAKYGERMAGHRAALSDQVTRRERLFRAMALAPSSRSTGWQLGREDRLADFLDDVEAVDFAPLRVRFPLVSLATGLMVLAALTLWLAPLALLALVPMGAALAGSALAAQRHAGREEAALRAMRREAALDLGAGLAALVPLAAEGKRGGVIGASLARLREGEARQIAVRRSLALLDNALALAGPVAGIAVLAAGWMAGLRLEGLLPVVFLGFAWLAFGEALNGGSRILLGAVKARAAASALAAFDVEPEARANTGTMSWTRLVVSGLRAATPDGRALGRPLDLTLGAGRPLMLTGASGCGKTSLLKAVGGWCEPAAGEIRLGERETLSSERRARSHLCLHDAAILADTFRENLFAPELADEVLWEALEAAELAERVRAAGGLDAWVVQSDLSLGEAQRLNLARAFLTTADLVLLDEPSEHLGEEQGERILRRLLARLSHRIVLIASHRRVVPGVQTVALDDG